MSHELELTADRAITIAHVQQAVNVVVFSVGPDTVEPPAEVCDWPKVCGNEGCKFPTYQRAGEPVGLVPRILLQLGYPHALLKDLDREHEVGEVLHPGVKIARSRNAALARIDSKGMALLSFLQERQRSGASWAELSVTAFGPRKFLRFRDARRRPWRY